MTFASEMLDEAFELLTDQETASTFTFNVESSVTHNPATGQVSSTTTQYTVKGSPPSGVKSAYPGGSFGSVSSLKKEGELQTAIPAKSLAFTPAVDQKVDVGNDSYVVTSVEPVRVADTVLLYLVELRR